MSTLVARGASTGWDRSKLGGLKEWIKLISAAQECAAAVEGKRRPSSEALRTIGIDEAAFVQLIQRR